MSICLYPGPLNQGAAQGPVTHPPGDEESRVRMISIEFMEANGTGERDLEASATSHTRDACQCDGHSEKLS
jgi:hypothetical protein